VQKNLIVLANNTTENLTCICLIENYLHLRVHWDKDDKSVMELHIPCQGHIVCITLYNTNICSLSQIMLAMLK